MNYFLIGMMGSGKTSLGKSLANDIDYNFIDLDGEIEKAAGIKINNIFDFIYTHLFNNSIFFFYYLIELTILSISLISS
jgi:shikimate kinase